jgi:phosphohistidine swiveling domain-containing protein
LFLTRSTESVKSRSERSFAYVVTPDAKSTSAEIGVKAKNLYSLSHFVSVPPFLVVTTQAFNAYERMQRMDPEMERQMSDALELLLGSGSVAIRSSATCEDLPHLSFAGLYSTTLDVENVEDGIVGIVTTWQSIDSQRAGSYRTQMGISRGSMAVIIQHQLRPEVSGVMVTCAPHAPEEMLIECCSGLGDRLVSGMITPTRYSIKQGKVISQTGEELLSRRELKMLRQTGEKIEKVLQGPQDIEWAIENSTLYILQSRPAQVADLKPRKQGTVWCNANVRETIPDPISPMGYSFFEHTIFPGIIINGFGFPLTADQYHKFKPVERVHGRLYWNVNNTAAFGKTIEPFLKLIEGDKSIDPQFAEAMRSVDLSKLPELIPPVKMVRFSIVAMVRLTYYVLLSFLRYRWLERKVRRFFEETDLYTQGLKVSHDLSQGIDNLDKWVRTVGEKPCRRYFGGIFISGFYLVLLGKLLTRRIGKRGDSYARMTTTGIRDKTGEMVLALRDLAAYVQKKGTNVSARSVKRIYLHDRHFRLLFDEFINEYGHRGPAEFDIASINWREDIDMVFDLIRRQQRAAALPSRSKVLRTLQAMAKPTERFLIDLFLPRIEAFTPLREDGKHHIFKVMSKIKDQLCALEKILIKRVYCKKERDIFFLTFDNLKSIQDNTIGPAEARRLVAMRKKEWHTYRDTKAPDIIYEYGEYAPAAHETTDTLRGTSVSFGKVRGKVRIIKDFRESPRLKPGEILVTHHTDPGWTPLFTIASGAIIETGGVICHAAMVAREFGLPVVVVREAMSLLNDGMTVVLDADEGVVKRVS